MQTENKSMDVVTALQIWICNKWNALATGGILYSGVFGFINGEAIQIFFSIVGGAVLTGIGIWGKVRSEKRKKEKHDLEMTMLKEKHDAELKNLK